MWTTWWIWVLGGLGLGVLELLAPGYIFLGFAIGATLTGGLIWISVLGGSLPVALAVFGGLSLAAWAATRALLGRRAGDVKIIHGDINDN